jgi:uncharacterized repeat protein (TIGR04076 family)
MSDQCCSQADAQQYPVEIRVTSSTCPKMPDGDVLYLDGPSLDYERSGPVCLTAVNAIYPWVMLARFGVRSQALEWNADVEAYCVTCPCGVVNYEIRPR